MLEVRVVLIMFQKNNKFMHTFIMN